MIRSKKNISLRVYVMIVFMLMAITMIAFFSVQSFGYFIWGLDKLTVNTMEDIAHEFPVAADEQREVLGHVVSGSWSLVPENIRNYIPEPPVRTHHLDKELIRETFFSPPKEGYFVSKVLLQDGRYIFVSKVVSDKKYKNSLGPEHHAKEDPMLIIGILGLFILIACILVSLYLLRSITRPVEAIQEWAASLTISGLDKKKPDFRFRELNELAEIVRGSLDSVNQATQREQELLKYASHELRTPIAVIRSNAALLKKVAPSPSDQEQKVRDRIDRASLTMKEMMETLLWLYREDEESLQPSEVKLSDLITQIVQDSEYLLQGKDVTLQMNLKDDCSLMVVSSACRIMLTNMIRNAFQHTQQGSVLIEQDNCQIRVINEETGDAGEGQQDLGFGLGLRLNHKLAEKFGWRFTNDAQGRRYVAEVEFPSS